MAEKTDVELAEEQLSFLSEMLDGTDPMDSNTSVEEETPEVEEPVQKVEEPRESGTQVDEAKLEEADQENDADKTIQSLREQILALSQAVGTDPLRQSVQETVSSESAHLQGGSQAGSVQETLANFLTEEELDRIIDEPALINLAFARSHQALTSNIQATIQQEVNRQILVNRAVTDFYQANEDLLPYSKFVQFVMSDVEKTNKDKTYAEIFKTTADECRKRLGLASTPIVVRQANNGSSKPAFAGSKKSNARPSNVQEMFDKNALEMMNLRD